MTKNFQCIRSQKIQELQCTFVEYVHKQSGATVIAIEADDPENFFCIHLRTPPPSSNGIAHILEHTTLTGSKRFPVKDPFFSMMKRSLNTFMNALTGADFTCYPAASCNEKDFYNLLDVYIDAVFHPLLTPKSFAQEGIRLEFASDTDPTSALTYKGIVFNEMKGALSSPTTRFFEAMTETLFPNSPYGFNAGGDPKEIPNLTHEELKAFHKKYYDPSQALFFFYGNLPTDQHLAFLEEKILSTCTRSEKLPFIAHQTHFPQRVDKESYYPAASDTVGEKTLIGFGFLTTEATNSVEVLALDIIDTILMGNDASVLKRAFLSSKLCTQASSSLDTEIADVTYILLLKGCEKENKNTLETILKTTLEEFVVSPIDPKKIESALHSLEFEHLEIAQEGVPFGLTLFARCALSKSHGKDPIEGLTIYSQIEELRRFLDQDAFFLQKLVQKYLLDNTHAVNLVMAPDTTLAKKEQAEEESKLEAIKKSLKEEQKEALILQAKELHAYQEEEDSLESLPKITLEDVSQESFSYALQQKERIFWHNTFTNHIIYADLIFPLPHLSLDDLWLLSFFCHVAPQVGCGTRTFSENLDYIEAYTGGLGVNALLYPQVHDKESFVPAIAIRGKALSRNKEKLFSLFYDMITSISFSDSNRLKELLLKHHTNLESTVKNNPLRYAILASSQHISALDTFQECSFGLSYIKQIRALINDTGTELQQRLQALTEKLFSSQQHHLVISCQADDLAALQETGFEGIFDVPQKNFAPWKSFAPLPELKSTAFVTSSSVAFSAAALSGVSYTDPYNAPIALAANLLENVVLHKEIREQGGAYGGGTNYNMTTGHLYLYAFRDPHIVHTKAAFDKSFATIAAGKFSEQDLLDAKLEIIQTLDAPIPPGSRAEVAYTYLREGKTIEKRNEFRHRVINATKQEIVEAMRTLLVPRYEKAVFVTFAGQELLSKEEAAQKLSLITERV